MSDDDRRLQHAARCLKLAEKITDPVLAARLREIAADFLERRAEDRPDPNKAH